MIFLQAQQPDAGSFVVAVIALLFIGALYLLPTIIAAKRGHHQTAPIAVINIVFGWTVLGWIASLAWSVSATQSQR